MTALARHALPLAALLFALVSMRTTVSRCGDGPDEEWDGFPVAFTRDGPTSLSVLIDVPALALDAAVYLAAAVAVVAVPAVRRRLARYPRSSTAVLWAIAVPVVAAAMLPFAFQRYMEPVGFGDVGCSAVVGREVHFGLPLQ